jgi:hypothetical protein
MTLDKNTVTSISQARPSAAEPEACIRRLQAETALLTAQADKILAEVGLMRARHSLEEAQKEARRRARPWWKFFDA